MLQPQPLFYAASCLSTTTAFLAAVVAVVAAAAVYSNYEIVVVAKVVVAFLVTGLNASCGEAKKTIKERTLEAARPHTETLKERLPHTL
mmetsp:Transcript_10496/g.28721  ORF Transcript_10496/g.28721 Transcript_10496/m.28721 type:complete len:89 (-) Transcript_10496:1908-2174(-)|eukprot:1151486-Pelagomonas_calceolata.AAC.2